MITRTPGKNPLDWEWAAGGTNEAIERLSHYCCRLHTIEGVEIECCKPKGHDGACGGYGYNADGVETYLEELRG